MQQEIVMDRERNMATDDTDTQVATADEAGTLSVPFGPAEKPSPENTSLDSTLTKSHLSKTPVLLLKDSPAQTPQQKPDFEKHGHTFPLYHYNGPLGLAPKKRSVLALPCLPKALGIVAEICKMS